MAPDIRYSFQGIMFEWDADKSSANYAKHGLHFETACEVFFDPFVVALENETIDGEVRHTASGMLKNWAVVYVVYVWREDTLRIISCRPATAHERKRYESG